MKLFLIGAMALVIAIGALVFVASKCKRLVIFECKKPYKRVVLDSQTESGFRDAFEHLKT